MSPVPAPDGAPGPPDRPGGRPLRDVTAAAVLDRDAVRVHGPDAAGYLQGQCSQDVAALAVGAAAEALLLSPQGKIDAYVRVLRTGEDRFVVEGDAGTGPAVLARLQRFRLRVAVELEPVPWRVVAVRGPEAAVLAAEVAERAAAAVAAGGAGPGSADGVVPHALPVAWPGLVGVDLVGPAAAGGGTTGDAWRPDGIPVVDAATWEAARIEAGIPVAGRELDESTIAAEVGLVERTVSFTKGCFTGQELVARLDARGSKVARHLRGLVFTGGDLPPVGADLWTTDGAHRVGSVTSVAWSDALGAPVGLGLVHRRIEVDDDRPGAAVVGGGADGSPVEVRTLPLVG